MNVIPNVIPNVVTLELLLAVYYQPDVTVHTQAQKESIHFLEQRGLVTLDGPDFVITDRGRVYIQMLLATPLPEQRWVDPRTDDLLPRPTEP